MIAMAAIWFLAGLVFGFLAGIFVVCIYGWEKLRGDIEKRYEEELDDFRADLQASRRKLERGLVLLDKAHKATDGSSND